MLRTPFHHLSSVGVEDGDVEKHLLASPTKQAHSVRFGVEGVTV
jgi:hypothetical protein